MNFLTFFLDQLATNHNQTLVRPAPGVRMNHTQTLLQPSDVRIANHNQALIRPLLP